MLNKLVNMLPGIIVVITTIVFFVYVFITEARSSTACRYACAPDLVQSCYPDRAVCIPMTGQLYSKPAPR